LRTTIAEGLYSAGRTNEALPLYGQAAAEAEAAGHWKDLARIANDWANALRDAGQLEAANAQQRASLEASRKAGSPEIDVLMSELEAQRIRVMQGEAERVRPEIEKGLERVRGWWQRRRAGKRVPEAPDPELLGRVMAAALDIAWYAARTLEDWASTLGLLEEKEALDKELGRGEHERARTRFNRYFPLLRLGRLAEAQAVLEDCLGVDRKYEDVPGQAADLSALADLWDERGDQVQAAHLERRALDLRNRLPDPGDRAISHNNLAEYLHRQGEIRASARHRLAAVVYGLVVGEQGKVGQRVHNLAIDMANARDKGEDYPLPTLAALLAEPEFDPLRRFLAERGVPVPELQHAIDHLVQQGA
jgi:tetratricopeptide (TPR) repeat protein